MSNKLVKKKETKKENKAYGVIANVGLMILIVAFIGTWVQIFLTTKNIDELADSMVEGVDYYMENVLILRKDYNSSHIGESTRESKNYYFYYGDDWEDKLFVDEDTYHQYNVGDTISAYTINHVSYSVNLKSLLPGYRSNEINKAIGVVLGGIIAMIIMVRWLTKKTIYQYQ